MRVTASAALLALRMWWLMIVTFAVVGAGLGVYAVRDAPYAALTTIRVDTAGFGEVAQQSIVQTARLLVDSNRVYRKVVGDAPGAVEELRQRTTVDIVGDSSVLELTVSAQSAEQAEQQVDRFAEAAIENFRELAEEQFDGALTSGQQALENGVLPDRIAEDARRDELGAAVAQQQDSALRLSAQLSRIGEVLPAEPVGLGSRIAAVIGGLTGFLIAAVLALLLGVGRRRIRNLGDVHAVAPGLVPVEPMEHQKGVVRVAAECSRLSHPLVVVLALPGAENDLPAVVDELRSELRVDGNRPFRLDATDVLVAETEQRRRSTSVESRSSARGTTGASQLGPAVPALGLPQRAVDLGAVGSDSLLVTGEAEDRVITLIGDRADVVLLVARPRVTKLGQLARVATGLGDGRPPVVVLAGGSGEKGDDAAPPVRSRETLRPAPIRPRVGEPPTMPAMDPFGAGDGPNERPLGRGHETARAVPRPSARPGEATGRPAAGGSRSADTARPSGAGAADAKPATPAATAEPAGDGAGARPGAPSGTGGPSGDPLPGGASDGGPAAGGPAGNGDRPDARVPGPPAEAEAPAADAGKPAEGTTPRPSPLRRVPLAKGDGHHPLFIPESHPTLQIRALDRKENADGADDGAGGTAGEVVPPAGAPATPRR